MQTAVLPDQVAIPYPHGVRSRRGLNWFIIGLLYASFYMCRHNFRFATPGMVQEFGLVPFRLPGYSARGPLPTGPDNSSTVC